MGHTCPKKYVSKESERVGHLFYTLDVAGDDRPKTHYSPENSPVVVKPGTVSSVYGQFSNSTWKYLW